MARCREETNPPQASVLHMGTQYLLYRTDNRFSVVVVSSTGFDSRCWQAVLGFDSHFMCDVSFLFFSKSTAMHRNHMKCVCALFIFVLWYKLYI